MQKGLFSIPFARADVRGEWLRRCETLNSLVMSARQLEAKCDRGVREVGGDAAQSTRVRAA